MYFFLIIFRSFLLRTKNSSDKICTENLNTHFVFNKVFFFENRASHEIVWKTLYSQTGHRLKYGACALHAEHLSYKHTLRACNTHCFSTATMVRRTRHIVVLYVLCLSCSKVTRIFTEGHSDVEIVLSGLIRKFHTFSEN